MVTTFCLPRPKVAPVELLDHLAAALDDAALNMSSAGVVAARRR